MTMEDWITYLTAQAQESSCDHVKPDQVAKKDPNEAAEALQSLAMSLFAKQKQGLLDLRIL